MSERLIDTLPAHLKEQFKSEFEQEKKEAEKSSNVIDPGIVQWAKANAEREKLEKAKIQQQNKK